MSGFDLWIAKIWQKRWWFTHKPFLIFIHSKVQTFNKIAPSLSPPTKYRFPSIFVISDKQIFISPILKVEGPCQKISNFSFPWEFKLKSILNTQTREPSSTPSDP